MAIERNRFRKRNRFTRLDAIELTGVRCLLQQMESFVTCRRANAPMVNMTVVVFYLFEWSAIDNGLITLEARPLFTLIRNNGDRAEFDSLDRAPRFGLPFGNFDPMETRVFERLQEQILAEGA